MAKYPSNPNLEIRLNKQRAEELARIVLSMKLTNQHPFDNPNIFPDAIVPEGIRPGSKEHALFLFYGCMTDSMRQADKVYESIRSLNSDVSLATFHKLSRNSLYDLLAKHIPNLSMGDIIEAVYANSRKLKQEYENDPRNIFPGFSNESDIEKVKQTLEKISEFSQYGSGKSALLIKNYTRFSIWDIPEPFVPIKIDRHVARICLGFSDLFEYYDPAISTDKIPYEDFRKKVLTIRKELYERRLQDLFLQITSEQEMSGIDLDDAFWLIGSKLCHVNDASYCGIACNINCRERPKSDKTTTYFFPGTDKRKRKNQLILPGFD